MDLKDSRDQLCTLLGTADLEEGSLSVVKRLDEITTPCAFVQLETVEPYLTGGNAVWRVYLVADNTDEERVLEQLEQLLNAVLAIGVSPAADIEYVKLSIPEQTQALPAFLVRINETV